ncbi:tRNA (guanosine(46)-N7)-methyltransferase TrmB [Crocosphaera sp. UHCC 0190]|uniref:tRNA (guanosine(46)-N7)-methyltransferase TrmB n=1 Tax=Crocosphaera sp. UHCC 0190 TaxID=3110246 RepID=UPI002B218A1D|nr:tRNA (guanosine(46)-N7)-methyltransferase TrmB [Crocosphaera sp. UHCC 0190]MEA5512134.1 tRNA (guanosine(46)-N7)-methyltransferase TrmB [Crocosphaera sp. UHCC 0190]
MARVRVRQHVNPLSRKYHLPLTIPDWGQIYPCLQQPLHLDIGCGRGKFLLKMASLYPEINFLGVEIREPLVIEANEQRDRLGLSNLHFLFCQINLSIEPLLQSFPPGILQWVSIQFPDPWLKTSHKKRRVVQPSLVQAIADYLADNGTIFLQSDVEEVAKEMAEHFLVNSCVEQQHQETWLEENPFLIKTEREIATLNKPEPIYRILLRKKVFCQGNS